MFVHLVPAFQEPAIAGTLRMLLASRYPHGKLHVVVVTKEEEERSPHPAMEASTAELVRRFRAELPPYQQKMLSQLAMPGAGRKAHQLNWALRAEHLRTLLGEDYDPRQVFIGVSDADSVPDRNVYRWIAADVMTAAGGEPRLPGSDPVPGQLRSAAGEGTRVRGPAVVDLHPRLDRSPHQRGSARALVRRA